MKTNTFNHRVWCDADGKWWIAWSSIAARLRRPAHYVRETTQAGAARFCKRWAVPDFESGADALAVAPDDGSGSVRS